MLETQDTGIQSLIMAELRKEEPRDIRVHIGLDDESIFTNYNVDNRCLKQYDDSEIRFAVPLNQIKMIGFIN